jgi:hypothetical protein
MAKKPAKPAPLEIDPSEQRDDNIDALGRKQDGSTQDQPATDKPANGGGAPKH